MHSRTRSRTGSPIRSPTTKKGLLFAVVLVIVLGLPSEARATTPFADQGALAVAAALLVVATAVVPASGAMITTIEGDPTKEWGRSSLIVGSIFTGVGGIVMTSSAAFSESSRNDMLWVGGTAVGFGMNSILWGVISEVTREADEDATGRAPAMLYVSGSF